MTLEKRQGMQIINPEEIALQNNWVNKKEISSLVKKEKSEYYIYILNVKK